MEGLLNFIISVQLTIGPLAGVNEFNLIPKSAEPVVYCVYLPVFVAYSQSPSLQVAIDEIIDDYREFAMAGPTIPPDFSGN